MKVFPRTSDKNILLGLENLFSPMIRIQRTSTVSTWKSIF